MLRRQRTILRLLRATDSAVSVTQLQKYLFLMRSETLLCSDSSFYEFLPYKFGPFSFSVQRELETLIAYGYVRSSDGSLTITTLGMPEADDVDAPTAHAVRTIVSEYGKKSQHMLLKEVYAKYAWFAVNSELEDLIPCGITRPKAAPTAAYTIGYESRSVDGFLNALIKEGIRRIIDVRANPVSRKYGFARSALAALASKLGIKYSHFPALGISSEKRKQAKLRSDFATLFGYYERHQLPEQQVEIDNVAKLMKAMPSALLCMEKDATDCHRSRLAARIEAETSLVQVHL